MTTEPGRTDGSERLRQFKAEFFKALAHPLRIRVLELLRAGPMSVTQLLEATGAPGSSLSQQLAVLRSRGILTTERRGTTVIYSVPDPALFELLDVARRLFNARLSETAGLLRLIEDERVATDRATRATRTATTARAGGSSQPAQGPPRRRAHPR
jgi:ArsR family transcriptional regulator